ncbi:hypothetical protein BRC65_00485, partial [Halobacteriales archaeon QH_2_65_14]
MSATLDVRTRTRQLLSESSTAARLAGLAGFLLLANAAIQQPGLFIDQAIGGLVYGMILVMVSLGLALVLG